MPIFIALALAIGIALFFIYLQLRLRLSFKWLLPALGAGATAAVIAMQLQQLGYVFGVIEGREPIMELFYGLFVVGLSSQLIAFLFLLLLVYPSKEFSEPFFAVLYSGWFALGMVFIETLLIQKTEYFLLPLLHVLEHLSLAFVLGYFVGMAKFAEDPQQNFTYLNSGLGASIIIQGLHEFFIWENQFPNMIVLILGTGFIGMVLMAHLFRQKTIVKSASNRQQHLEKLYLEKEEEEEEEE